MKFLVDAQLPPMLAEWLRRAGHETKHVQDVDLRDADDALPRLLAHLAEGATLVELR